MNEPLGLDVFDTNPLPAQIHGGCCFWDRVLGVGHVKSFGSLKQVKETGRNDFAKPIKETPQNDHRLDLMFRNQSLQSLFPGDFPDQPDSRSFWEDSS